MVAERPTSFVSYSSSPDVVPSIYTVRILCGPDGRMQTPRRRARCRRRKSLNYTRSDGTADRAIEESDSPTYVLLEVPTRPRPRAICKHLRIVSKPQGVCKSRSGTRFARSGGGRGSLGSGVKQQITNNIDDEGQRVTTGKHDDTEKIYTSNTAGRVS